MRKLVVAPIHYFYSDPRNPLPRTISLEGGYQIRQFDSSILTPVFEFFHESFSAHQKRDLQNSRYAIYYSYTDNNGSSEIPDAIVTNINRILLTLRIVKRTRAVATMLHFKVEGRQKDAIQVVHQPTTNITFPTNTPVGSQHFNVRDAAKIRNYWKKVQYLYSTFGGTYHKILNAIYFFEFGHHNHMYKPRLVQFVTCLESLFNTSEQQIGYTFRLRCSQFLERNPNRRVSLSHDLRDIYRLRSLFVHGQGTPANILNDVPRQERLLSEAEEISRRCLQKVFDRNLISQFDNAQRLNDEFERLELGLPTPLR